MRRSTVVIELAGDAPVARDLAAGGVFVPGCSLRMADECDLVVCGANRQVSFPARVVYVDEHGGAGLELIGFSTQMREQLAELEPLASPSAAGSEAGDGDDLAVPIMDEVEDNDRTVPVATGVRAAIDAALARPAPEADLSGDDLAVPIADDAEDDLTVPISTGVHSAVAAEAARSGPGGRRAGTGPGTDRTGEPAGRPPERARQPRGSDPAVAIPRALIAADAGAVPLDALRAEIAPCDVDAAFDAVVSRAGPETGAPETGATGVAAGEATATAETAAAETAAAETTAAETTAAETTGDRAGAAAHASPNLHERLRGLPLTAQLKLATIGELHERIVLERLYGKNVWETLLRNPRLTPPEVSRIARYGSLPRVLLEVVLANNTWLQVPEVRRALLSNPRLGADQIMKVLRLVPKHELRLAAIQTAYPQAVRNAAKMLLRGD